MWTGIVSFFLRTVLMFIASVVTILFWLIQHAS